MRLWAIWDTQEEDWWANYRGHATFSTKSAAIVSFNGNRDITWREDRPDGDPRFQDQDRYVLRPVILLPIDTGPVAETLKTLMHTSAPWETKA